MARPRRVSKPQLSPVQASYVLDRIIADRSVSAGQVGRYVAEMQREIGDLERRLEALREANHGRITAPSRSNAGAARPRAAGRKARKRHVTAEQSASRQLQGRYLGLIRQIPASRRGRYQKIAREKGREAAIKEMASALGK